MCNKNSNQYQVCINLEMEFAINSFRSHVDHFKRVAAVAVHVTVAQRRASATEQKRHLVS